MKIELVRLIDGQTGHDFVLYNDDGKERFSARLMHGSKTLYVLWTDNIPWTPHRLSRVKRLLMESESFEMIVGRATTEFADAIDDGTLSTATMAQQLSRALRERWTVVIERGSFDQIGIAAFRSEEQNG